MCSKFTTYLLRNGSTVPRWIEIDHIQVYYNNSLFNAPKPMSDFFFIGMSHWHFYHKVLTVTHKFSLNHQIFNNVLNDHVQSASHFAWCLLRILRVLLWKYEENCKWSVRRCLVITHELSQTQSYILKKQKPKKKCWWLVISGYKMWEKVKKKSDCKKKHHKVMVHILLNYLQKKIQNGYKI